MKNPMKFGLVCLLAMLLLGMMPVMPLRAASDVCNLTWRVVPSPNSGAGDNRLVAVAAVSEKDIWAVGFTYENNVPHSLLLHWDGAVWTLTPTEDVGYLSDIAVISPTDIWIAGNQPLHWDGVNWSVVASPFRFRQLSALASDDIWGLAGDLAEPYSDTAIVLHWDGTAWTEKVRFTNSTPLSSRQDYNDIYAVSADNVWVVGSELAHASYSGIMARWDGVHWTWPDVLPSGKAWSAVTGTSATDVWFGGRYSYSGSAFTEHWNGSALEPSTPALPVFDFTDLEATDVNSVWAVGYVNSSKEPRREVPVVEHWTGDQWRMERMPKEPESALPFGVEVLSDTNVWAVGVQETEDGYRTLILHGELPCLPRPVVSYPPATPALRAPADNKLVKQQAVVLQWERVEFGRKYQVQVFAAADTTKPLRDLVTRKREIELENLGRGIYAWHVRACNPLGCSGWSEMRTFRYTFE